jgi:Domain of unknown function (DUF4365)
MLPTNDIEEALSRAYVTAIAGRAGFNLWGPIKDFGTDGTFREIGILNGQRFENGWSLDFQLKASINCALEEEFLVYDLDADTYRKLLSRSQNGGTPMILIVMALPHDSAEWLAHSEDYLLVRKCCYWHFVTGEWSENKNSVRIRIPRTQQLTVENLKMLFTQLKGGSLS